MLILVYSLDTVLHSESPLSERNFLLSNTHSFFSSMSWLLHFSSGLSPWSAFTLPLFTLSLLKNTIYPGCCGTCVLPDKAVRIYYVSVSPRRLWFQITFRWTCCFHTDMCPPVWRKPRHVYSMHALSLFACRGLTILEMWLFFSMIWCS